MLLTGTGLADFDEERKMSAPSRNVTDEQTAIARKVSPWVGRGGQRTWRRGKRDQSGAVGEGNCRVLELLSNRRGYRH